MMTAFCSTEQELTSINSELHTIDDIGMNIELKEGNINKCGVCCVLKWFYSPFCSVSNFFHSFYCFIYHWINFIFTVGVWSFESMAISTSISLIIFACIGILFLWITFEIIILISRCDLWINYLLIEQHKKQTKPLLILCIYIEGLPLFRCDSFNGFCIIMVDRAKHLFTSCNFYKLILYHIIIKPIIILLTGWSWFIVVYIGYYISIPIWYNKTKNYQYDIIKPEKYEYAVLIAIGCLLFLPISIKINNFCADISKRAAYYFYINCCCHDNDDKRALIEARNANINININIANEDMLNI